MGFIGRNSAIEKENILLGINGSVAINQIPQGYCLDARNADFSTAGVVTKRPGYHIYPYKAPIRTKMVRNSGGRIYFYFDTIPYKNITIEVYRNTAENATVISDARFLRTPELETTVFCISTEDVDYDTIICGYTPSGRPFATTPILCYDSRRFILPAYILQENGVDVSNLTDTTPYVWTAHIGKASGKINRLVEKDIDSLVVLGKYGTHTLLSLKLAYDVQAELYTGCPVLIETRVRGVSGELKTRAVVTNVTVDSITLWAEGVLAEPSGIVNTPYLSILYLESSQLFYREQETRSYLTNGTYNRLYIEGEACVSVQQSLLSQGISDRSTLGWLYGLNISPNSVQGVHRHPDGGYIAIVDGYPFWLKETEDKVVPRAGYKFTTAQTVQVENGKAVLNIPNASAIYKAGDTIMLEVAEGTRADPQRYIGVSRRDYFVEKVTNTSITITGINEKIFSVPAGTTLKYRRKSDTLYIDNTATSMYTIPSCTLYYQERNALLPIFKVRQLNRAFSIPYIKLDTPIEYTSEDVFILAGELEPMYIDKPLNFSSLDDEEEINFAILDNQLYIASKSYGIAKVVNRYVMPLRIPRMPSGLIRNAPVGGGQLKISKDDTTGDIIRRRYDFCVTYSYYEERDGKILTYESGLNPVSSYSVLSEPDPNNPKYSRLVELQIPTLPNGIGVPADRVFINVYRTKSGIVETEASAEPYLLERRVQNNPNVPYITVVAGTESPFIFNAQNFRVLYKSLASVNTEIDELQREHIDPPITATILPFADRLLAAAGFEYPSLAIRFNEVFNPTDDTFSAHFAFTFDFKDGKSYRFFSAPCNVSTTLGSGGEQSNPLPFQIIHAGTSGSININSISLTDNSHIFTVSGAATITNNKYKLKFAGGFSESQDPTSSLFYDNYNVEAQTFVATNTTGTLRGQKKWVSKDSAGNVRGISQQVYLFGYALDVDNISPTSGLVIIGNSAGNVGTNIQFRLYVSSGISTNDYLILAGLGTTGQIIDNSGKLLNFDTDLVFHVVSYSGGMAILRPLVKGGTGFVEAQLRSAVNVFNSPGSGNTCPPFTIYKASSLTPYSCTGFSLSPTQADIVLASAPPSGILNSYVYIEGLDATVPPTNGVDYRGALKVVNVSGNTVTVRIASVPPTATGDLGYTFSAPKPTLNTSIFIEQSSGYVTIKFPSVTLAHTVRQGDYIFLLISGSKPGSQALQLCGWHKIHEVSSDGTTFVTQLNIGDNIQAVRIPFAETLNRAFITGVRQSRIILAGRNGTTFNIPIPVVNVKNGVQDICLDLFAPLDGYTPYERLAKPLTCAINHVLRDYCYAYCGGKAVGNVESLHSNNSIPPNGLRIVMHRHGIDATQNRYTTGAIEPVLEPEVSIAGAPTIEVTGNKVITASNQNQVCRFLYEYRGNRVWSSIKCGTLQGLSFRELSVLDLDASDGETITGLGYLQDKIIIAKRNSLYVTTFHESGVLNTAQRIPGAVGAVSHRSIANIDRGVFFIHDTGIYITDSQIVEPVYQISRHWKQVVINSHLLHKAHTLHDIVKKVVYFFVPFSETGLLVDKIDTALVFNYSQRSVTLETIKSGWTVYSNLEARSAHVNASDCLFCNKNLYRIRTERSATLYLDDEESIRMWVKTRFIFSDDSYRSRFLRNIILQLGKTYGASISLYIAHDWLQGYQKVQEWSLSPDGFGISPFGQVVFGCDRIMKNIRNLPQVNRLSQISLMLEDSAKMSAGEIYGIFLESLEASTLQVTDKGDR